MGWMIVSWLGCFTLGCLVGAWRVRRRLAPKDEEETP